MNNYNIKNKNQLANFFTIVTKQGGKPEDWEKLLKAVNSKTEDPNSLIEELIKKFKDPSFENHILTLDLVDYLMDYSKAPFHNLVSSRDFISALLLLLKIKNKALLQAKVLYLIKKWAERFEEQKLSLPIFSHTYNTLLNNGVIFPESLSAEYTKYLKDCKENETNFQRIENYLEKDEFEKVEVQTIIKYGEVFLDLDPENYHRKYRKFVAELGILLDNMKLANDMIDHTNFRAPLEEGIKDIVDSLKDLEKNLASAIEHNIEDEKLLAICLGINDDLNKTFLRYEELVNKRKPPVFISCFLTDYKSYNLNLDGAHNLDNKKPAETSYNLIDLSENFEELEIQK